MNCHNGARFLAEAISSVLTQTYDDYEIVLWDNQSTDRSGDIARSFGDRLRYFQSDELQTLGRARNAAISKATGRYVAFLDVDDVWSPDKLALQVELLDANEDVALVYSDMERIVANGNHLSRWSNERLLHRGWVLDDLLVSCFVGLSSIVVRRDVLKEVGGFDPRFSYVEEWDLYLRIAERYRFDYVADVLAFWRLHDNNASRHYDQVTRETCVMLDEWAQRSPEHARLCRRMSAAARFKLSGVNAFRAFQNGQLTKTVLHFAYCGGLALRHPTALPKVIAPYLTMKSNRRVFRARFS